MTIKQYCEVINLTDQRVKQLIKQNILKKDIDYKSEVVGITPKFTFCEEAIKSYHIYKQNCRKKKWM